jgi:hypothetical protein
LIFQPGLFFALYLSVKLIIFSQYHCTQSFFRKSVMGQL